MGHTAHLTKEWQRVRNERRRLGQLRQEPCGLCGQPIDYTLNGNLPDGAAVDHIVPLHQGGAIAPALDQLRMTHTRCNKKRRRAPGVSMALDPAKTSLPTYIDSGLPRMHPDGFPLPRIETPVRPGTDYTLADRVLSWIDEHAPGPPLMPWQRYVVRRGFEVADEGPWRHVAFLVSRQQGKTYMMQRVLLARASLFEAAVLNTHPDVSQAVELLESLGREMESGYLRARMNGVDWWLDADGVREMGSGRVWRARAQTRGAITGQGGIGFVFVDELQDARTDVINRTVRPVLSGARVKNPQAWYSGTGERDDSEVLRQLRDGAGTDVLWLEWSAPPGCATDDRNAWRWASPDWSPGREASLASDRHQMPERDFRSEYLVQHDAQTTAWIDPALVRMRGDGGSVDVPSVGAIDVDVSGRLYSAAVSDASGSMTVLPPGPLDRAVEWLRGFKLPLLIAHPSVIARLPEGIAPTKPVSPREMQAAVSVLDEAVRAGTVRWDHADTVAGQFASVVLVDSDGGPRLVASRSRGDVSLVKVLAVCAWWVSARREPVMV